MEANKALSVLDRAILPDVATLLDMSDIFGLPVETVEAMCEAGEFPATRVAGRWFVERGILLATLRDRATVAGGAA